MKSSNQPPVNPGDVIAAKYRVERVLGQGGMGVVVEAVHQDLDERVALKFLLAETLKPEGVERFMREAKASVRIKSEHVARVSDVGKLDNGAPYMVMEFLQGSDLGAVIEQRGCIPAEEAVDWVLQACEALAEAHALGIVHRDLKPQNLFLTTRPGGSPLIKVLDFGIAKTIGPDQGTALTRTSQAIGSPLYMSPEQMRNAKNVDERTDIWSLGVILYQLLSGETPFEADTIHALCAAIIADPPVPLLDRCPGLPPALGQVIMRCLSKAADQRYGTVAELALALQPFGGPAAAAHVAHIQAVSATRTSRPPPSYASSTPSPSQQTIDPLSTSRPPATLPPATLPPASATTPQRPVVLGLSLLAVGALGLAGWLALGGARASAPGAPALASPDPTKPDPAAASTAPSSTTTASTTTASTTTASTAIASATTAPTATASAPPSPAPNATEAASPPAPPASASAARTARQPPPHPPPNATTVRDRTTDTRR